MKSHIINQQDFLDKAKIDLAELHAKYPEYFEEVKSYLAIYKAIEWYTLILLIISIGFCLNNEEWEKRELRIRLLTGCVVLGIVCFVFEMFYLGYDKAGIINVNMQVYAIIISLFGLYVRVTE